MIFNLRDGRVGLIHRIHPNIQLAIFDSLDELWDPPPGYWDEHLRDLDGTRSSVPREGALGVGAGAPPVATDDGPLLFFHEREGDDHYTTKVALLDDETGRRAVAAARPDHASGAPMGVPRRHRQHHLRPRRRATARRHDLSHLRRSRPLRRRGQRADGRDSRGIACRRLNAHRVPDSSPRQRLQ